MEKIRMTTPLVEMDGDEMTRILWQMIKDELKFSCLWRINTAKLFNTAKSIINEVGTDLAHHSGHSAFGKLRIKYNFFGLQFFCF